MDVTKPYEIKGFGSVHGPKPYKFIGCRWAFISQTPVVFKLAPPGPSYADSYPMLRNSASGPEA